MTQQGEVRWKVHIYNLSQLSGNAVRMMPGLNIISDYSANLKLNKDVTPKSLVAIIILRLSFITLFIINTHVIEIKAVMARTSKT